MSVPAVCAPVSRGGVTGMDKPEHSVTSTPTSRRAAGMASLQGHPACLQGDQGCGRSPGGSLLALKVA